MRTGQGSLYRNAADKTIAEVLTLTSKSNTLIKRKKKRRKAVIFLFA